MVSLGLLQLLVTAPAASAPTVEIADGNRTLVADGEAILTLNTPWVATGDWQGVYNTPDSPVPAGEPRVHTGAHGRITETITAEDDAVTIRYDFDFADLPTGKHIQWWWRLAAEGFDAAHIEGEGARNVALRPIGGSSIGGMKRIAIMRPDLDLDIAVSASTGEWTFADQRQADWAKCYRLEYNRPFTVDGRREGGLRSVLRGKDGHSV